MPFERSARLVAPAAWGGFAVGVIYGMYTALGTVGDDPNAFAPWGLGVRAMMMTWLALLCGLVVAGVAALGGWVLSRLIAAGQHAGAPPSGALQARSPWRWMLFAVAALAGLEGLDRWISRDPEPLRRDRLNLVLIVVDALRADRLGCYGYPQPTSPHIDALASRAVRFDRAVVQYPATGPSFGSLFTGKYPRKHGLSGMDPRLWLGGDFNLTLAEILSAQGYATGAVITGSLTRSSGLARGFQTLFEEMPAYGLYDVRSPLQTLRSRLPIARSWVRWQRSADQQLVTTQAERWLERQKDRSFFLFLHLYDTHSPYEPPLPYVELAHPGAGRVAPMSSEELRAMATRAEPLSAEEIRRLNLLYAGLVRAADDSVGRILDKLAQLGLSDETVIVLTADHGEELYDHGKLEHGHLFNTNLLVPLILAAPGGTTSVRVDSAVELVDLLPTLLTLLHVPVPPHIDGQPLPLEANANDGIGYAFSEADCGPPEGKACKIAVQERRWKLTLDRGSGTVALFDLDRDPLEHADVSAGNAEVVARLEAALRKWDSSQPDLARLRERYKGVEVSEEIRERLRQLGYIE